MYLFYEQVVALLRPSRLTDNLNLSVDDGDDRLDVEKSARKSDGLGDAPALLEIFERIKQRDKADLGERKVVFCVKTAAGRGKWRDLCKEDAIVLKSR